MLIAGVLCMCAAVASAGFGTWSLAHNRNFGATALALRAMAPTQLAAAVMLGAGGVVALAAVPHTALVVLIVCVAGGAGDAGRGLLAERAFRAAPGSGGARVRGQLRRLHAVVPLTF